MVTLSGMVTLRALDKKILRDLGNMWAKALAIAVVIAAGLAMLVIRDGMLKSLVETSNAYYDGYGFAPVFAPLQRAPKALAGGLVSAPRLG